MSDDELREIGEEGTTKGISRRTVLKTIGVGTAVAWAAPMIKSVPAFGAARAPGSPAPLCPACLPYDAALNQLGGGDPVCGFDTFRDVDCVCVTRFQDDACLCHNQGGFCYTGSDTCATDADCEAEFGAGYQCLKLSNGNAFGCGGTGTNFCGGACNSGLAAPARDGVIAV